MQNQAGEDLSLTMGALVQQTNELTQQKCQRPETQHFPRCAHAAAQERLRYSGALYAATRTETGAGDQPDPCMFRFGEQDAVHLSTAGMRRWREILAEAIAGGLKCRQSRNHDAAPPSSWQEVVAGDSTKEDCGGEGREDRAVEEGQKRQARERKRWRKKEIGDDDDPKGDTLFQLRVQKDTGKKDSSNKDSL